MTNRVEIDNLKPNKWFLDRKKLEIIRQVWRDGRQHLLLPILITMIDNETSLIDGHCRAFAAWENGAQEIQADIVPLDRISGSKELYVIFHRQAPSVGIRNISDLGKRIYDLAETLDPDFAALIEERQISK
jgi:hypothetical protein